MSLQSLRKLQREADHHHADLEAQGRAVTRAVIEYRKRPTVRNHRLLHNLVLELQISQGARPPRGMRR